MVPKDIRLIPEELFIHPQVKDLLEWTCLRSWVREWLKYCYWYLYPALIILIPQHLLLSNELVHSPFIHSFFSLACVPVAVVSIEDLKEMRVQT